MPAADQRYLIVDGIQELGRAFNRADKVFNREYRQGLRSLAEPVQEDAERFAQAGIRRIGLRWYRMRIGVTTKLVYVAPKERGRQGRRNPRLRRGPRFAALLSDTAMQPALDRNVGTIEERFDDFLGVMARDWSSG